MKAYFVYPESGGSREDCSVFYSSVVFANSKQHALQLALEQEIEDDESPYEWNDEEKSEWLESHDVTEAHVINYTGLPLDD